MVTPDEKRNLDFAFLRFFRSKYPIEVTKRMFSSVHRGSFHNHDFPQIWYCLHGRYFHQVGDQVYECTKGSAILIPTGVFHKFRIREGESVELICLNVMYDAFLDVPYHRYLNAIAALFLPAFSKELGYTYPTYWMLSRESQAAFEEHISWLSLLDFTEPGAVVETDILEKLEAIFSLPEFALPECYRQKAMWLVPNRLYPMVQVLCYLNKHYGETFYEDALLHEVGIGHTFFHQYFKRYTGYIYSQYLQMLRMKHVHIYLSRTTYPLTYISDMCGFCNAQYMSLVYKKHMGKSPRESRLCLYDLYHKKEK